MEKGAHPEGALPFAFGPGAVAGGPRRIHRRTCEEGSSAAAVPRVPLWSPRLRFWASDPRDTHERRRQVPPSRERIVPLPWIRAALVLRLLHEACRCAARRKRASRKDRGQAVSVPQFAWESMDRSRSRPGEISRAPSCGFEDGAIEASGGLDACVLQAGPLRGSQSAMGTAMGRRQGSPLNWAALLTVAGPTSLG